ncbi:MAG: DUF1674 domain-containing protein [Alphaproteobacteria bacterium]|jgi:hypothetical protein|nr:DUF1674 domain-containing protein [Alphaproteobacteria bacterium]
MTDQPEPTPEPQIEDEAARRAKLPEAAQRALAEADARRAAEAAIEMPRELGGRKGPEPIRFGDWEKKGIAIDF